MRNVTLHRMLLCLCLLFAGTLQTPAQINLSGGAKISGGASGAGVAPSGISSPLDISGCIVWLDANDITQLYQNDLLTTPVTSNNDPVGGWKDKSGNANHFLQSVTGSRPTYKTGIKNLKPAINFGGSHQLEKALSLLNDYTAFVVVRSDTTGTSGQYETVLCQDGNRGFFLKTSDTAGTFWCDYWTGADNTSSTSTVNSWVIFSYAQDGIGNRQAWKNGVSFYSASSSNLGITINRIGGHGSEFLNGYVSEVVIYNRQLTGTEVGNLETLLNNNWAVH